MWTRNYYTLLTAAILADDTLSNNTRPTDYTPPLRVHSCGDYWAACVGASKAVSNVSLDTAAKVMLLTIGKGKAVLLTNENTNLAYSNNNIVFGIALGSGTTEPSYEDFKLASVISSGLSLVSAEGTLSEQTSLDANNHIKSMRKYTINNTTAGNITINEYGIYIGFTASTGPTTCLVYREVLTEPVVLGPSESFILLFSRDAEVYNYTPYPA